MIKYDEKRAVLHAVGIAIKDAIAEQNNLYQENESTLNSCSRIAFQKAAEQAAKAFFTVLNSQPLAKVTWLPEELDRIPDPKMRGALGLYNAAINQLEFIKATGIFNKALSECS